MKTKRNSQRDLSDQSNLSLGEQLAVLDNRQATRIAIAGAVVLLVGICLDATTRSAIGNVFSSLLMAAGPVTWGVVLGTFGDPKQRKQRLVATGCVLLAAGLLGPMLRQMDSGGAVAVGSVFVIVAVAALFMLIGQCVAGTMRARRGRGSLHLPESGNLTMGIPPRSKNTVTAWPPAPMGCDRMEIVSGSPYEERHTVPSNVHWMEEGPR